MGSSEKAKVLQRFFKTGPGEYGEGDIFIGVKVPDLRKTAKKYQKITLNETKELLNSKIHEERLVSTLILIQKFNNASLKEKGELVKYYLDNTQKINNWDLVDLSAPQIIGEYLKDKQDRTILYKLAESNNLWDRRISIITTLTFIRNNQFSDTIKISQTLLNDKHDLIQKAVGWMLREVGKRDIATEERFLRKHSQKMPRTMLRYAIENFSSDKRLTYLNKPPKSDAK